ncbi:MAG TPA: trypsin-like peptidase domain-containing protein [Solirubrobacteraceae bacterium]|nr:trypsin-like peptidase domain-containing protein [Solirubrobacteraceae bacterium]
MSRRALLASAVLAAVLAGCGGSSSSNGGGRTTTVERTKVEVVQNSAAARSSGFDPAAVYSRVSPGVVTIISTGVGGPGGGEALGSGFVISGSGEVATNAHVVTEGQGADIHKAGQVYVSFADGNQVPAKIVGFDPFADVALLRVDPAGLTLRPLTLGSDEHLTVGAPVAAIGSPFGEEQSLSVGIISATGRSIDSLTGFQTTGAIQTDAAINHGNSGGPLLDAHGRVLGINSQIQTSSGDGSGVGFAVPIDTVKRSLAQIRRTGHVRYAFLGVTTSSVYPQLARRFDLGTDHGAWIQQVTPGGPADKAGLRAGSGAQRFQAQGYRVGGDIVVTSGGTPIRQDSDLAISLLRYLPGQQVTLEIVRDRKQRQVKVTLGERPLGSPQ